MSEFLAVDNGTFEISVTPAVVPGPTIATPNNGTATPILPGLFGINDCLKTLDAKCKIQGDVCLKNKISQIGVFPLGAKDDFVCAPVSVPPYTFSVAGIYQILAGSVKNNMSVIPPMLENDVTTVNCACTGIDSTPGTPIAFTGSCSVTITKAGQSVTKGV